MKLFYKNLLIFGIIVVSPFVILFVVLIIYLTYKIPLNNYRLMTFQNDFRQNIKSFHPTQSTLIIEIAEVGNWADGTYCEFIAGEFRSSPLSKEELEKIYPYDFFTAGVYFLDEDVFNHSPWSEWKEKYLKNYKPKNGENTYLVWASDQNKSANGDIRCD